MVATREPSSAEVVAEWASVDDDGGFPNAPPIVEDREPQIWAALSEPYDSRFHEGRDTEIACVARRSEQTDPWWPPRTHRLNPHPPSLLGAPCYPNHRDHKLAFALARPVATEISLRSQHEIADWFERILSDHTGR